MKYYYLKQSSPTHINLGQYLSSRGWKSTRFQWRAHFGEMNLQLHPDAAQTLEFKHLLAQLIQDNCPHVMPETYIINDDNWIEVLQHLTIKYPTQTTWILKPALLNNGQHIKIFTHFEQIEQHYLQSQRLSGPHVLQRYITQPHLLQGHKYSTRLFIIITNYAGAYLYPHGYCNVAQQPYLTDEYQQLNCHLTNEHLNDDDVNVIQIPTQRFDFFPAVYRQMYALSAAVITALKQKYPQAFITKKLRTLGIFGFDFINDADGRVWLLEANHGPCFPIDENHSLQKYLYQDFWEALIDSFIVPIAERQSVANTDYTQFHRL